MRLHDVDAANIEKRDALGTRRRGHEDTQNLASTAFHGGLETGREIAGVDSVEDLADVLALLGIISGLGSGIKGIRRLLGRHRGIFHPLIVLLDELVLLPAVGVQDRAEDAQAFQLAVLRIDELIISGLRGAHGRLDVLQDPKHLGTEGLQSGLREKPLGIRPELVENGLLLRNGILGCCVLIQLAQVGGNGVVTGQARVDTEGLHLAVRSSHGGPPLVLLDLLEADGQVMVELLGGHGDLLEHLFGLNHLGKHPLIGSLEIRDQPLDAALKQQRVLDLESIQERRRKLLIVRGQTLQRLYRHTIGCEFCASDLGLKLGRPGGHPVLGTGDIAHLLHVLNSRPIALVVVDAAELGRIAGHHQDLLEGVELHAIQIRNGPQGRRHLLLVPRRNGLEGNADPLNRTPEEIHQEREFVRTVNDGRSREGDHFAVNCGIEALVELASELRLVDDAGDEVVDLINDDHATRIRVRTVLRNILCDIRRG